jgi:hypothetical protein
VYAVETPSDARSETFIERPLRLMVKSTSSPGEIAANLLPPSEVVIDLPSTCVITSPRWSRPSDGLLRLTPSTTGSERKVK